MAFRGTKPTVSHLQPVVSARGRAPKPGKVTNIAGAPVMPTHYDAVHAKAWKRYVVPAYWLTRVDEVKAAMFVNLWVKYDAKRGEVPFAMMRLISTIGSELGFDPVARQRMSGEVFGRQERRSKRGGKGGAAKDESKLDEFA